MRRAEATASFTCASEMEMWGSSTRLVRTKPLNRSFRHGRTRPLPRSFRHATWPLPRPRGMACAAGQRSWAGLRCRSSTHDLTNSQEIHWGGRCNSSTHDLELSTYSLLRESHANTCCVESIAEAQLFPRGLRVLERFSGGRGWSGAASAAASAVGRYNRRGVSTTLGHEGRYNRPSR